MISIVVPAFNAERFLQHAVESVFAQTCQDWELILVDDGSTDTTPAMCDRMARTDGRIRVVHKPNGGLSDARNAGLDVASGEWISFLDADDALHPDALSLMLLTAAKENADIVCGGFHESAGAEVPVKWRPRFSAETISGEEAVRRMLYQKGPDHSAWGKIYSRRVWGKARFRRGIWYEDLDLFYRLFLRSERVALCPRPLYLYRKNPDSFLHRFTPGRLDVLDVCDRMCAYMEKESLCLVRAAHDRRLSAAFNIFGLLAANRLLDDDGYLQALKRCREIIRSGRRESLADPEVRLKNRIGILASYAGGFPLLAFLSRFIYR